MNGTGMTDTIAREDYDPESPSARLALVIARLNRRLNTAQGGLSHGLLSALGVVAKLGSVRLVELAAYEMVSAPSITRVVAELESRGLVVRSPDPDDGRAFRIQVTPAGTDAILNARATRTRALQDLLRTLEPADVAAVRAALPALERMTT
jgi:DNA-binding MarR family transcriptional regulator